MQRTATSINPVIRMDLKGECQTETPSQMVFVLEAAIFSRVNVTQSVSLYNYVTDDFEEVDSRQASRFTDGRVEIEILGDLSRFVEAETQCMEARVEYTANAPRARFSAGIDQANWWVQP